MHSKHWRETSSYVAATRHRDETAIFVSKDTARDLPDLARQMGRVDEHRSASQFHAAPAKVRPDDFTRAATEAAGRPPAPEAPTTAAKAAEPATAAPTREQVAAQRKAALIGRIKDPARQAAALYRLHKAEAIRRAKGGASYAAAPAPTRSGRSDEAMRRLSDRLGRAAAEVEKAEAERPAEFPKLRDRGRTR